MERTTPIHASGLTISIIFLLILIGILPVQAFTADSLSVEVMQSGDARIIFNYTLTLPEQFAVYLKVADPNAELKKALESNFHHPVTIESVTNGSVRFMVSSFATLSEKDGKIRMETPAISFTMAEKVLKKYWFAPLVHPDYSPQTTTILYPDGYTETFTNQIEIPKTSHLL
ncbi:MAG: hypothetical protein V1862_04740 [Methanobacteriota archaeon]